MFSTPIYASARPLSNRIHVNLWHGSGPKWSSSANFRHRIGASFLACTATAWAHDTVLGLVFTPSRTTVVTGNPRQDFLQHHAATDEQLRSLGIDPLAPFVVWAPTYRRTKRIGAGRLNDGEPISEGDSQWSNRNLAGELLEAAKKHSVQLFVKPHPEDADTFAGTGLGIITSDEVWAAKITLHQLLGRASAMISDYSSIWVDFMATGRSVALLCPDLASYSQARSLNRPLLGEVADGILLKTAEDVDEFFSDIGEGRIFRSSDLSRLTSDIGFVPGVNKTRTMFREVGLELTTRPMRRT